MRLLVLLLLASASPAQRPSDIVKWSATAPAVMTSPGGTVKVSLTAKIERGWKLYALTQPEGGPQKLAIEVASGAPFTVSQKQIAGPAPKTLADENFGMKTQYYEKAATFTVPVTVSKTAATGALRIPLEVTFQACGESLCLRPFTEKLEVGLSVGK
ncbi:MAG TPA: protein-disulfide reductase DsbD N-terminal domain-containing protein [Vicinamibacterales bacterium]|nr:protein-disulfide reductase DsbD N-terminal domain-containing protein [Vicinamibacterales bacterium]